MKNTKNELLGKLMVKLMEKDTLFTYDFLVAELRIRRAAVSAMKQGKDLRINCYLRTIAFLTNSIHLYFSLYNMVKIMWIMLNEHKDVVIGTVPHREDAKIIEPENLMIVARWKDDHIKIERKDG